MKDLPEITLLNSFLSDQISLLKDRVKTQKSRRYADVRNNIIENKLFQTLSTDEDNPVPFLKGYESALSQCRSVYQLYRLIESIQLKYTARMSGIAISNLILNG